MILFEEDWYKEENLHVVVHNETTNESFIRLHHILKKMGIKNNKFFLALHDERLKNVDPYSPTLTDQEIGLQNVLPILGITFVKSRLYQKAVRRTDSVLIGRIYPLSGRSLTDASICLSSLVRRVSRIVPIH